MANSAKVQFTHWLVRQADLPDEDKQKMALLVVQADDATCEAYMAMDDHVRRDMLRGAVAGRPIATVHIQLGRRVLPSLQMPIEARTVQLLEAARRVSVVVPEGLEMDGIVVKDSPCSKPQYQRMSTFDIQAQPGQHIYVKAKRAGARSIPERLLRLAVLTMYIRLVSMVPVP